ncbi:MAG: 4Fe-4S binding protein, partial [Deltaproteobacteria bacterium]|nr:4Fe-4S binding protein [Deltaproteobacteria bacterium]
VSEAKRCLRCDCGFCVDTCFYDAVKIVDNNVLIKEDACEGCGLCVCNCPKEALFLKEGTELVRKLARGHS